MRIATFNINGVVQRLSNLLAWLASRQPDAVCLQEIKCTDAAFPDAALKAAGYGAVWRGQGPHHGVAILARGAQPVETRRAFPGGDADREARYIEATVGGVLIGCLYLPSGNPRPGPKVDYKLAWFDRLIAHASTWGDPLRPEATAESESSLTLTIGYLRNAPAGCAEEGTLPCERF